MTLKKKLEVVVAGSGLGELCFFARLGLGLKCTGYERICGSVADAQELATPLKAVLHPRFICGDVESAKVAWSKVGVLWLNNWNMGGEMSKAIIENAASRMPP